MRAVEAYASLYTYEICAESRRKAALDLECRRAVYSQGCYLPVRSVVDARGVYDLAYHVMIC